MSNSDIDEETSTTLKVFKFSGKDRAKWREWKIKTLAYARRKGFVEAFTKIYDDTDLKDEKKVKTRDLAIDYLISSLTDSAFTKVTSKTTEDPFIAWDILIQAYERREEEDLEAVQEELSNLKMGKHEEPDDFYNKLLLINERLSKISAKYELDDLQMKIHLLSKLPDEYQMTKKAIQVNGLGKKDVNDIVKDLNQVWKEKGYNNAKESEKNDTNVALNVEEGKRKDNNNNNNNKKKFERDCGYCGKKFHKAKDCRGKKSDEEKSKETGVKCHDHRLCYNCKKQGHLAAECPNKDEETGFTAVFCVELASEPKPLNDATRTGYTNADVRQFLMKVLNVGNDRDEEKCEPTGNRENDFTTCDDFIMINDDETENQDEEQIIMIDDTATNEDIKGNETYGLNQVCSVTTQTTSTANKFTDEWLIDSGATINVDNDGSSLRATEGQAQFRSRLETANIQPVKKKVLSD